MFWYVGILAALGDPKKNFLCSQKRGFFGGSQFLNSILYSTVYNGGRGGRKKKVEAGQPWAGLDAPPDTQQRSSWQHLESEEKS